MKTALRLRLHATQAQPCFPAASNALALPGGNGIFTATPTERITHYTLLRKVVCQMGALPPLETPTRKGGTLPLHGAHTAFSCYPALRLYRLSKSPRGIDVVSLTLGNSPLPFGDRPVRHMQGRGQLLLGHILFFPGCCDQRPGLCPIHTSSPGASISNPACSHNKRCVEPPRFRRGAVSFGRVFPPHGCSPPRCSRSTRITRFMPSVRYLLRWRTRK